MCGDDDLSFILKSLMGKLMGMSICKDFPFLLLNGHLAFYSSSNGFAAVVGA